MVKYWNVIAIAFLILWCFAFVYAPLLIIVITLVYGAVRIYYLMNEKKR
jgi:hypothetical protein